MARLNERMIVADSKDDPPQTTSLQAQIPTDSSSSLFLAISFPVDPWPPALLARDHSILTQFFITRIDDQVRILALEFAPSEASQLSVQLLVDLTDRTRAKTVFAELFTGRFYPSS